MPKSTSDSVFGGTMNQYGAISVKATRVGADSAIAQIVKLVEEAQTSKVWADDFLIAVATVVWCR